VGEKFVLQFALLRQNSVDWFPAEILCKIDGEPSFLKAVITGDKLFWHSHWYSKNLWPKISFL